MEMKGRNAAATAAAEYIFIDRQDAAEMSTYVVDHHHNHNRRPNDN